jgi:hypothetical protein
MSGGRMTKILVLNWKATTIAIAVIANALAIAHQRVLEAVVMTTGNCIK